MKAARLRTGNAVDRRAIRLPSKGLLQTRELLYECNISSGPTRSGRNAGRFNQRLAAQRRECIQVAFDV
jgi:hypothetical protein